MKKNIIISIITAVLLVIINSMVVLADSETKVYVDRIIKYENTDEITANIYMENVNENIVTLGLDLKYDKNKLEYVSSKAGKDLEATIKYADNKADQQRLAIAIIAMNGLKKDGVYYQVKFKVKDTKNNIPLNISVREATDSKGNDIEILTSDGMIVMSNESTDDITEPQKTNQKINRFKKQEVEQLESIEKALKEYGNIKVKEEDSLTYQVEDDRVIEVLDDGMIIPNKDGTTRIQVRLNDQNIGTVEVTVVDGKVKAISGNDEIIELMSGVGSSRDNSNTVGTLKARKNTIEKVSVRQDDESENLFEDDNVIKKDKSIKVASIFSFIFVVIIIASVFIYRKWKRR